ncbi:hypothetical protein [Poseidonocella sp. HB161398]|uniref:hypothetical protein n=1 Tax=Poseidonocella sp. HB161398 TaxID=2320855 RepID=UPI001108E449|nr:hypothetical protein [Poseidonocella sp. HB161398]
MKRLVLPALAGLCLAAPVPAQEFHLQRGPEIMDNVIAALGITDARIHPDDKGPDASGHLPGGTLVELDFHRGGEFEEIEAPGSLAPVAEIAAVVPKAVRDLPQWPADGSFEKFEIERDKIELEGRDASGRWFKAEFDPRGRLLEWKYD